MRKVWFFNFFAFLSLALVGCGNSSTRDGGGTSSVPEVAYCSTVQTFSSPITLTGSAIFKRRVFTVASGLGAVDATDYPIRYAEVRVLSGSTVVQCGETDNSGNFSVDVPAGTYTVQVNARAYNSQYRASVLRDPTSNAIYSISTTVTASTNTSVGTLRAEATGEVLGGAFNILEQVLRANEYLRAKTSGCTSPCTPFTVATKATLYWKLGLSPSVYLGSTGGISFYYPGRDEIYLTGGLNDNPNNTDTDHFDNPVILHEYGHFLEDNYSVSNSPGGSHSGNSVIDPRLAWSEGFGNWFGVEVNNYFTNDKRYLDTYGNSDVGTTYGYYFKYDIDDASPFERDTPAYAGEGNFREFSIARALFDAHDTGGGDDDAVSDANMFAQLWTVMTNWNTSSYAFRNYGLLMELQAALSSPVNVASILTAESQRANRTDYGTRDAGDGCATTASMLMNPSDDGTYDGSDQFRSNDFYHITHAGGAFNLTLTTSTGNHDLDLYVYKSDYTYGEQASMAAASATTSANESINTSLAAGEYMVNVMGYSGSSSSNYLLTLNGGKICP